MIRNNIENGGMPQPAETPQAPTVVEAPVSHETIPQPNEASALPKPPMQSVGEAGSVQTPESVDGHEQASKVYSYTAKNGETYSGSLEAVMKKCDAMKGLSEKQVKRMLVLHERGQQRRAEKEKAAEKTVRRPEPKNAESAKTVKPKRKPETPPVKIANLEAGPSQFEPPAAAQHVIESVSRPKVEAVDYAQLQHAQQNVAPTLTAEVAPLPANSEAPLEEATDKFLLPERPPIYDAIRLVSTRAHFVEIFDSDETSEPQATKIAVQLDTPAAPIVTLHIEQPAKIVTETLVADITQEVDDNDASIVENSLEVAFVEAAEPEPLLLQEQLQTQTIHFAQQVIVEALPDSEPYEVEQASHVVIALPEIVQTELANFLVEAEPEVVESVAELMIIIGGAADRLHELAMDERLGSEEAEQIEKLLVVWYEDLLTTLHIEPTDELIKTFIQNIKDETFAVEAEAEEGPIDEGMKERKPSILAFAQDISHTVKEGVIIRSHKIGQLVTGAVAAIAA